MQSNIDRVLIATEWETRFPLSSLTSLTRLGSDHCPIMLDTGESNTPRGRHFFYERQWAKTEGFLEKVNLKWGEIMSKCPATAYSMDRWHGGMCGLRQYLKGWGNNIRGEYKRERKILLEKIQKIDSRGQGVMVTQLMVKRGHSWSKK